VTGDERSCKLFFSDAARHSCLWDALIKFSRALMRVSQQTGPRLPSVGSYIQHCPAPAVVVGPASLDFLGCLLRASLLDEWLTLRSPYTHVLILYGEINTPHPLLSIPYSLSREAYGDQLYQP